MAELIAVAYPDKNIARDVVQTLSRLQKEHVVELADVVVATKEQDGKVRLVQGRDLVAMGALGGALWGGLIGLLFFAPLLGMVFGMAGGALGGKFSDYGIDDRFMKDLAAQFQPGGAAVFVLINKATPDKVLDEVGKFGGKLLRTSLSRQAEADLQTALDQQHAGAGSDR
ncbi:MAG TPA: DUF1269 domain-containing protein [Gemmatimonadales bacterium]|jgi:Predicted membrane protein